jgi:predicted nuclease with RNAse H fold
MANVVGIDLSGPANIETTAVARFEVDGGQLHFVAFDAEGSDANILQLSTALAEVGEVVIGLDAPLSYQPGGGMRERDLNLTNHLHGAGYVQQPAVMAPMAGWMVYLTLRGVVVARGIGLVAPSARVVETHPTAAMAFRGAPPLVRFLEDLAAHEALEWLEAQGLHGIPPNGHVGGHLVAACAAALAAWRWHLGHGNEYWMAPAEPPSHPFDFAC